MGIGSGGVAGPFTTEEYPQPGMEQTYGSAYLWVDTGAYVPPKLNRDISATDLYIPVDDTDAYPVAGTIRIGTEYILYGAKRDEYLVAYARGANSSIPAAHSRSDAVYPCYDANADSGLSVQTGALVDRVTIVRQDGKPVIEDGALLWSNLPGPGDPSTGGQLWERHPDWNLATRWQGNQSSIIEYVPPVAPVTLGSAHVRQARHWCVVGHRMQYYFGRPQRFKINEVSIWEFSPHAGVSGGYEGHGAGDFPGVVGHIVTQHAGLPVSKFGSTVSGAGPIGELHITPTTVQSALGSTLGNQYMTVYNDRWNNIYLTALPGSVLFPATLVSWTWTELNCWGGRITGGWSEAHPCAQAIVWATEPAALRQYYYEYPPVADRLGNTVEARDVIVASYDQGREIARALYRSARTRRSIQLSAGACPWLNKYQRHVVNLPGLDKGGAWSGINMYVRDYTVEIGMSPNGITWNTTIQLAELAL